MQGVLAEAAGVIEPNDPRFEAALEAERDMQILAFALGHAEALHKSANVGSLVKRVLNDSVLPQDDRRKSSGRDAQLELFVAAVCESAGLVPVDYAEPDIICTLDGVRVGLAAKRVKNVSRLVKRVKEAAKQLARARLRGIVVLDTCLALNPTNERIITPMPDDEFRDLYRQAFNRFLDDYACQIYEALVGYGVLGLVFHDHQVRVSPHGEWGLASMTVSLCTAPGDEQIVREFSIIAHRYTSGLPNLGRL
jgi:hypothetical protein